MKRKFKMLVGALVVAGALGFFVATQSIVSTSEYVSHPAGSHFLADERGVISDSIENG